MAENQLPPRLVRFGAFEAELRTGELRKHGLKLKFSGQPFQVLAILLERPGDVVTREELQRRIWPDTFVDVERSLNTAVNKIREILGDSAETPRFVETLPRRGYRFIGEVETPVATPVPGVAVELAQPARHRQLKWKIGGGVLSTAAIALAALLVYRGTQPQRTPDQGILTAIPFTALPGVAASPAFSPDGSRIAFAWNAGLGAGGLNSFDLYVKGIGGETLLRLTQHPSAPLSPAWSPEGTRIAFYREAGADSGIYMVSALGGPERKLRSTADLIHSSISWSPDGTWIAYVDAQQDHRRIYLLSTDTLEAKRVPVNSMCSGEDFPAFSHNGESLAYWCFRGNFDAALSFLSLKDGNPKTITPFQHIPRGVAWSADDKRLIFSHFKAGKFELSEVSIANGSVKPLGLEGTWPAVSLKGDRLAYSSLSSVANLWRRDLLRAETPALEFIPSSRSQFDAQYSPDRKRIAFASMRSGVQGVWISNEDGSNMVQISNPDQASGSPQWSPDGKKIAFDSFSGGHWEVYVADVAEGKPRKLLTNMFSSIRPSWSRDGKWVYFAGEGGGIYRCPASGGEATLLSNDLHAVDPQESFDGKTIYFSVLVGTGGELKKVAATGQPDTESKVDGVPRVMTWTLAAGGIYFVPVEAPTSVQYFEFASKRVGTIFAGNNLFASGLSISPDGRWILYSQEAGETGDIMLVDHFR